MLPAFRPDARPRIAVSRTRPPEFVQELARLAGADLVPIGSAGAKISAVLTGEVEAYVHAGGQYEWDSAAPVAVALAAGAHASRVDGSPWSTTKATPHCRIFLFPYRDWHQRCSLESGICTDNPR